MTKINTQKVRLSFGGKEAFFDINIKPVVVDDIYVENDKIVLNRGETSKIVAQVTNDNASDKTLKFTVANDSVATVDEEGNIFAKNKGETEVRIDAADGKYKVITVKVLVPCSRIILSPDSEISLKVNQKKKINCTLSPIDTTDTVSWSTSDSGVAKVEDGVVTAVGNGFCVITATTSLNVYESVNVYVDETLTPTVPAIIPEIESQVIKTVDKTKKTFVVGEVITVSINGISNNDIKCVGKAGSYDSVSGELTLKAKGSLKLFTFEGKKKRIICNIKCVEPKLKNLKLKVGKSKIVKLKGFSNVVWTSSDEEVASVGNGTVVAVASGSTLITAYINGHPFDFSVIVK